MEKEKIMLDNRGLIIRVANQYYKKVAFLGLDFDDLYQEAWINVYNNLDEYDGEKSSISSFITNYATYGILNYITANSSYLHVPEDLKRNSRRLVKENIAFYNKNGRNMTGAEMVDYAKNNFRNNSSVYDEKYVQNLLYVYFCCLNDKFLRYDELTEIPSSFNFEDKVLSNVAVENTLEYLKSFSVKSCDAFIKYYGIIDGDNYKSTELAKEYDISKQAVFARINYIQNKILENEDSIKRLIKE